MWTYEFRKYKDFITIYHNHKMFETINFENICDKKERAHTMITWLMDTCRQIIKQQPEELSNFIEDVMSPLLKEVHQRMEVYM